MLTSVSNTSIFAGIGISKVCYTSTNSVVGVISSIKVDFYAPVEILYKFV